MKLATIFLIASIVHVSAASMAQQVTLKKTSLSFKQFFKEVRKQTGYSVIWESEKFNASEKLSVDFNKSSLSEVFDKIFVSRGYSYLIDETTIIIQNQKAGKLDNASPIYKQSTINVSGRVVGEDGVPLGGATITVKTTGKGVTALADGNFSLSNIEEGSLLTISFIGYQTKEVKAEKTLGTIKLELSTSKLDEIQIQAYGQTTQRMSISNITSIKAEEIEKQNVTNPLLAIQGRVPGLTITPSTGLPNSGITVRIFGQNSFGAGQDPLYVIDGIPYPSQNVPIRSFGSPLGASGASQFSPAVDGNPMSFVNPDDIESIDVLKDASATSIYGSRAANGAIIITTKKGRPGKMKINFNVENGRSVIAKNIPVLNANDYIALRKEAFKNDNILMTDANAYDIRNLYGWSNDRNTNWQKELLSKNAQFTTTSLGIMGGTATTNYLFSGTYSKQGVSIPGDYSDQKGTLHASVGASSTDQKFKIQFTGTYTYDQNLLPVIGNNLANLALQLSPTAPEFYNFDGTINWAVNSGGVATWDNIMAKLKNQYRNRTSNLISNLDLSYEIFNGLQLQLHSGYNNISTREFSATLGSSLPPQDDLFYGRIAAFTNKYINSFIVEPKVTYNKSIGVGQLNILLGATINQVATSGLENYRQGYSSDNQLESITFATAGLTTDISNNYKYAALFSRLNYTVKNRYIVELTGRRDGSSRFGPENRYHSFGAIGLAWIFSEEKLIKDNLSFLSFAKLRFNYGIAGNDQIGDYTYLDLYNAFGVGLPYQQVASLQATRIFTPSLQWEESKKSSYGLDLGFFKDRVTLSTDYYRNISGNSLYDLFLPRTSGQTSVLVNNNVKIKNDSWEFKLTSRNIHAADFKWKTDIIFSRMRNKLLSLPTNFTDVNSYSIGKPMNFNNMRYYDFAGVDPATGKNLYRTANGGLTFTPNSSLDRNYIDLNQKWRGGINNSISYKSLSLDFFIDIVKQKSLNFLGSSNRIGRLNTNTQTFYLNHWKYPGDQAFIQKASTTAVDNNFASSDGAIIDGSFIKLRNVSLAWLLPKRWTDKANLKNLTIYSQAQNPLWLSSFQGYDPETGANTPPVRIFTIGLRASL